MKQTLYFLFIFIFINSNFLSADTLPDCPSDKNETYHNCYGSHLGPTGMQYTGEWKNNMKHGMGSLFFENGTECYGQFHKDLMHGIGVCDYAEGMMYKGEFKFGEWDGLGIMSDYKTGHKVIGGWNDNYVDGYAIFMLSDGKIHQHGIFAKDLFIGPESITKTNKYEDLCEDMGHKKGTEKYALCVVENINNN